jgi:hypothetical protein
MTKKVDTRRGKPMRRIIFVLLLTAFAACAPEVGSEAWCEDMDEKPKGDWSANEATAYAKNCVFK